ncbi:hypothetical protein BC828DRAFT_335304, partial [Blastocladiella britannica]
GLGACGYALYDTDAIVAVSFGDFAAFSGSTPNGACGKTVSISHGGKTITAKIADKCGGCVNGDVDMTPVLFNQLYGDLGLGRVQGTS